MGAVKVSNPTSVMFLSAPLVWQVIEHLLNRLPSGLIAIVF
jgi:hypothetical protein